MLRMGKIMYMQRLLQLNRNLDFILAKPLNVLEEKIEALKLN